MIFNAIHPVGKATRIKFIEIVFKWKNDRETNEEKDILGISMRYTLFWDGPIHKDGYTKIAANFDPETERWSGKILETDGVTNENLAYGLGFVLGAALAEEQNK